MLCDFFVEYWTFESNVITVEIRFIPLSQGVFSYLFFIATGCCGAEDQPEVGFSQFFSEPFSVCVSGYFLTLQCMQ